MELTFDCTSNIDVFTIFVLEEHAIFPSLCEALYQAQNIILPQNTEKNINWTQKNSCYLNFLFIGRVYFKAFVSKFAYQEEIFSFSKELNHAYSQHHIILREERMKFNLLFLQNTYICAYKLKSSSIPQKLFYFDHDVVLLRICDLN